jgi:hypothetical protein
LEGFHRFSGQPAINYDKAVLGSVLYQAARLALFLSKFWECPENRAAVRPNWVPVVLKLLYPIPRLYSSSYPFFSGPNLPTNSLDLFNRARENDACFARFGLVPCPQTLSHSLLR